MNTHNYLTNILTNFVTAILYITCVKQVNMAIACKSASVKHLFMQATQWATSDAINVNIDSNSNVTDIKVLLGGADGANKDSLNVCFTVIKDIYL